MKSNSRLALAGLGVLTVGTLAIASLSGDSNQTRSFTATVGANTDVTFPTTAAFYYPWFPETWSVNGVHVKYHPTSGYYTSDDANVIANHMAAFNYAHINVAIASWWGKGTHNEQSRIPLLLDKAALSGVRIAFYYEKEGSGNPSQTEITADLNYLQTTYGSHPGAATVNGKIVVFVYNADDTTCSVADKWKAANTIGAYIDLKVFANYTSCASQPQSWHQYSPASPTGVQGNFMYAISPGFWRADETTPRLARDITRWQSNVTSMNASTAQWHLITTFNEWGEGTAIEPATEWTPTSGGYGDYLDTLHTLLVPTGTGTTTTTITPTTTTTPAQAQAETIAAPLTDQELKDLIAALTVISNNRVVTTTTPATSGPTTTQPTTTSAATTTTKPTTTQPTTTTKPPTTTIATTTTKPATTTTVAAPTTTTAGGVIQTVVVGAGDVCKPGTPSTAKTTGTALLAEVNKGAIPITMGDNQYETGSYTDYQACYNNAWGSFKTKTHPSVGNHEYGTSGAAGYFQYWGTQAGPNKVGYYNWTINQDWIGLSLNTEISGTAMTTQITWLKSVLSANPTKNVIAYFHEPVASSGEHGPSTRARQLYDAMYPLGVDIILTGHDHDYEQFALLGADPKTLSPSGVKVFVVGTGGASHYAFGTTQPGSLVRNSSTYGYIKLTLRKNDYDFAFIAAPGTFADSGHGTIVR